MLGRFVFCFFLIRSLLKIIRRLYYPYNNAHGVNLGPTWVLSATDGPHLSLGFGATYIRDLTVC